MRRTLFLFALLVVVLPALWAVTLANPAEPAPTSIKPQIQNADRNNPDVVFLEHADLLTKHRSDSFMVVSGNVLFRRLGMTMLCDSAHYWPGEQRFRAFGNVKMQQGDTLFVYADSLDYDDRKRMATLFAEFPKHVVMINRDVRLETNFTFYYDLGKDLAWYDQWGVLTDPHNTLESLNGEYSPTTKDAVFTDNVTLNARNDSDTLVIKSDALYYNTITRIAELYSPSEIINRRGTIFTSEGVYYTATDSAELFERSTVVTPEGRFLTADTLFYSKPTAQYTALGSMILSDTVRKVMLTGDYGFYNERIDSAFVTGRALMKEYSKGDTLYLHGRYIESFLRFDTIVPQPEQTADSMETAKVAVDESDFRVDSSHVTVVYPRVRFFRSDLQGICDSLRFTESDSMLRMFVSPIIWNEQRQITGNIIAVHFNDSTFDRVDLPRKAFSAELIEDDCFNQISGKELIALFNNGELSHIDISGNVDLLLFPEEPDSTINKFVTAQSSYLSADFKGQTAERIKMWPETTGQVTPLFLAKRSMMYLPNFRWFDGVRPVSPDDVMVIPEEMNRIIEESRAQPEDEL